MTKLTALESTPKQINWVLVDAGRTHHDTIQENELFATFTHVKNKKTNKIEKKFRFRFTHGLLKKMGLEETDRVMLCYDADDQKHMMLFKNDKGNKLCFEQATEKRRVKVSVITVRGDWCVLDAFIGQKIEYTIDNHKRLLFRLK